jgi:hypothetical protein
MQLSLMDVIGLLVTLFINNKQIQFLTKVNDALCKLINSDLSMIDGKLRILKYLRFQSLILIVFISRADQIQIVYNLI